MINTSKFGAINFLGFDHKSSKSAYVKFSCRFSVDHSDGRL